MTIRPASKKFPSVKYDGTNSAEVITVAELSGHDCSIVSESGGVLVVADNLFVVQKTINSGEWVYIDPENPNAIFEVVTNTRFNELFFKTEISVGFAVVPTLLLSQSATVTVTLEVPFFDAAYSAVALLSGSLNLLGALQVNSVTVVDEDTVDVVVQNTGLVTLSGASVLVVATKN